MIYNIIFVCLFFNFRQNFNIHTVSALAEKHLPTSTNVHTCSSVQVANSIANKFISQKYDSSGCPGTNWMSRLYNQDETFAMNTPSPATLLKERIFINIGFNKGYNFADFLYSFAPWTNIHTGNWHNCMMISNKNDKIARHRGACNEAYFKPSPSTATTTVLSSTQYRNLFMIGIDVNANNIRIVNNILKCFRVNSDHHMHTVKTHLLQAAGGSGEGMIEIPDCRGGDETCKIITTGHTQSHLHHNNNNTTTTNSLSTSIEQRKLYQKGQQKQKRRRLVSRRLDNITIPILSVDSLLLNLQHEKRIEEDHVVDILQIDTEGNDPLVLEGAQRALETKRIRLVIFEYHELSPWNEYHLENIISKMYTLQYDCFFEGREGRLWHISHTCWVSGYEFRAWSNVACFLMTDPWHQAIQPFIVTV